MCRRMPDRRGKRERGERREKEVILHHCLECAAGCRKQEIEPPSGSVMKTLSAWPRDGPHK